MKFKIRYSDQIVGFFSLLAIVMLLVFVFMLGAKQNWFVKKNMYYTYFSSGSGFAVGMDVTYKGFAIGKIKEVRLEGSEVRVDYYILGDYAGYVKENSLVELITSPIGLGSSFVFHPGLGPGLIESGSEIFRIDSVFAREIIKDKKIHLEIQEDSIGVLMKKVSAILDNVNILLYNINGAISGRGETPVTKIVANISEITKNLSLLTEAMNSSDGAVPELLGPELTESLDNLLKNVSMISDEISSITENADSMVMNAAPEIDSMLLQLNSTLMEAQDVLTGVKNNPLIRGGVPDRKNGKASTNIIRSEDF